MGVWSMRGAAVSSAVVCAAGLIAEPGLAGDGDTNVGQLLRDSRDARMQAIEDATADFMDPYWEFKHELQEEHGFSFGIQYAAIYQIGTQAGPDDEALINNIDVFGDWVLVDSERAGTGSLVFLMRDRREFLGATTAAFAASIGTVIGPNDTGLPAERELSALLQLWWKHALFDDRLTLAAGKIDQGSYFNGSTWAGNDKRLFLATPLATNPARGFPGEGLGANATAEVNDLVHISFGFGDANADLESHSLDTINEGDFFYAGEVRFVDPFKELGAGEYRFTLHYQDTNLAGAGGVGFALSFDQEVSDSVAVFLRYGQTGKGLGAIERAFGTGVVLRDPFGLAGDAIGFGFAWADPSAAGRAGDVALEAFWRVKLAPSWEVSPDVQLHLNPSAGTDDVVGVFTLRLRGLF